MTRTKDQETVIYCRVSSVKQVREGHGLGSQDTRCREYAAHKGYAVVQSFHDEGVSGGLIDRPGMQAMLAFLRKHRRHREHVVIIDDISRLARDLEAHIQLRTEIGAAGGKLESPSIEFGEDSDSVLVENLLASVSQHQRQKNAEQTRNRMRARVSNGYWVFLLPVGYRFERVSGHGKMLVRDEPLASIVTQALEGFASGRFETQAEVKRFLESHPEYPKTAKGDVRAQHVADMLSRQLYAGYMALPDWNLPLRKARHEALISLETHERIQERLTEGAKAPARPDLNADFPLRGFILCNYCSKPLTACWSQGKAKKYAYYLCPTKGCASYRKSIAREKLEGEFEALLHRLRPSETLFALAKAMLSDLWDIRLAQSADSAKAMKSKLTRIEKQSEQLLDRVVEASSMSVVEAYEARIAKLEREKALIREKLVSTAKPLHSFEQTFEHAMSFLANPWKIWASGELDLKRTVLRLAFAERLPYCRNDGLRTPAIAAPFKALGEIHSGMCEMASPRGFEPLLPP